jgi:hypothetical protein
MSDQQAHAWANALTPSIIEQLFGCLENGEISAALQDLEDRGLIGPVEWVPADDILVGPAEFIPEMISESFLY